LGAAFALWAQPFPFWHPQPVGFLLKHTTAASSKQHMQQGQEGKIIKI
jgi:hypothetical protein